MSNFEAELIAFIMFIAAGCFVTFILTRSHYIDKIRQDKSIPRFIDVNFEAIRTDFDNIINAQIDLYFKFHPDLLQAGESYISRDSIPKIISDITANCFKMITPAIENNLKFVYNFKNNDELIRIIGEKVGLIVAGMAARINNSMAEDVGTNIFQ